MVLQRYVMNNSIKQLVKFNKKMILEVVQKANEVKIVVPSNKIVPFMFFLKKSSNFLLDNMVDITSTDVPFKKNRFGVIYNLMSVTWNQRLLIEVRTNETVWVPTVTTLFQGANWLERETFDMFGVFFEGHTDLRRILTDYGFRGHPLRKDFPMVGFVEVRFDEATKGIVYTNTTLSQDFRRMNFDSPWME